MEPDGAGRSRTPPVPRIGWGVPDPAVAFVLSLVAASIAVLPFVSHNKVPKHLEVDASVTSLLAQTGTVVAYLAFAARKGRGSLTADFGLRLRIRDGPWFAAGFVLSLLSGLLIAPIVSAGHLSNSSQDVVRLFQEARGWETAVFALAVLVVAPLGEELLFRGALLRALMRRTSPAVAIWGASLAFALVHVILDPGAGFAVPALLLLGLLSGYRALRTGDLSQSILLHAGFNLLAVLQILT
ncbi:MAG TPA: CPBP family intramembrane glutamic endopeptidase [Acidimicrobiia bacterium]|nr:CPBP family intramembrane glutamic endopeptidase [Acidimicrobiia bacterium]